MSAPSGRNGSAIRNIGSMPYWLLVVAGLGMFLGLRRQVGPVPAASLAARRDGRADAGQRPDPRGHDGRRRRLPRRPVFSAVHAEVLLTIAYTGGITLFVAATIAVVDDRHQEGAGLFDVSASSAT